MKNMIDTLPLITLLALSAIAFTVGRSTDFAIFFTGAMIISTRRQP
jgi:hypothetical protein